MFYIGNTDAGQRDASQPRRKMAATSIAASAGLAILLCSSAALAQTMTWGLFQENLAPSAVNYPGNCWTQAMISGNAINGDLLQGQLTQQQAQDQLVAAINQRRCMNQADD